MLSSPTPHELYAAHRAKFSALHLFNKTTHAAILGEGKSELGHGHDHDLSVLMNGIFIAEDPRVGELAGCVALGHSWDRHYPRTESEELFEKGLALLQGLVTLDELERIREANRVHSKMNDPLDGPVTICLKDADRISNLGALNIARGAQHHCKVPVVILETLDKMHPNSTFRKPACWIDALRYNLEWEAMLRLPKAKELGAPKFQFIRDFLRAIEHDFRSLGLFPPLD